MFSIVSRVALSVFRTGRMNRSSSPTFAMNDIMSAAFEPIRSKRFAASVAALLLKPVAIFFDSTCYVKHNSAQNNNVA